MTKKDCFEIFQIKDINKLPDAIMDVLKGDKEKRDEVFRKLLEINKYRMDYDWFQQVYEENLSERKSKGQDFTPMEVCKLIALMCGNKVGSIYDGCAGNGGVIIMKWYEGLKNTLPWEYFPSKQMVVCWELSYRSIPILLLNLAIRGIMGFVFHGDVLNGSIIQKYILWNEHDNPLAFSDVVLADK